MKAFFDRFAMKERVDEMRGEPETKTGFLQSMESCAAQAEEGSKVHCDVGYEMLRCYCRAMKQVSSKPFSVLNKNIIIKFIIFFLISE